MTTTPEQTAWLTGHLFGEGTTQAMRRGQPPTDITAELLRLDDPQQRRAFVHGYGYGIAGEIGTIPGHHLALVRHDVIPGEWVTRLVPDRVQS